MFSIHHKLLSLGLLAIIALLSVNLNSSSIVLAEVEPTIEGYYSPCMNDTYGHVTTWHGMNQDGQPPYDPDRRTFDFRCQDKHIFAPHDGVVWGVTPRFGGLILIDDTQNNACMVFLGMHGTYVEPNQSVETGTYLGFYGHAFHFTAVDGLCQDVGWYDTLARDRERPIIFEEFGDLIAPDIPKNAPLYFTSLNPATSKNVFMSKLDKIGW